jgi:hypothetical protein
MTPLAQRILRDALLPEQQRQFRHNGAKNSELPLRLARASAFEMTAVFEMVPDLGMKMLEIDAGHMVGLRETTYAFLPAPRTWMEFAPRIPPELSRPGLSSRRHGILLEEVPAERCALATICISEGSYFGVLVETIIQLQGSDRLGEVRYGVLLMQPQNPEEAKEAEEGVKCLTMDIYPMLALINTPKVIGRREHAPHKGLQRQLKAAGGAILRPWTEIMLDVTVRDSDGVGESGRLSGGKALHFCRQYLRIRLGRLEIVRSHWRGDPVLGVVRASYTVRP